MANTGRTETPKYISVRVLIHIRLFMVQLGQSPNIVTAAPRKGTCAFVRDLRSEIWSVSGKQNVSEDG